MMALQNDDSEQLHSLVEQHATRYCNMLTGPFLRFVSNAWI